MVCARQNRRNYGRCVQSALTFSCSICHCPPAMLKSTMASVDIGLWGFHIDVFLTVEELKANMLDAVFKKAQVTARAGHPMVILVASSFRKRHDYRDLGPLQVLQ